MGRPEPLPAPRDEAGPFPRLAGPPPARTVEALVEVPAAGAYVLRITLGEDGRPRFSLWPAG